MVIPGLCLRARQSPFSNFLAEKFSTALNLVLLIRPSLSKCYFIIINSKDNILKKLACLALKSRYGMKKPHGNLISSSRDAAGMSSQLAP